MNKTFYLSKKINTWQRIGAIIERGMVGEFDSSVTGDPCIVWNGQCSSYHMFYFAQQHINGKEVNRIAHAQSCNGTKVGRDRGKGVHGGARHRRAAPPVGSGAWRKLGPIIYQNPQALLGDAHKPWIMMDPFQPNIAAKIEGFYWLFMVIWNGRNKVIQAATSSNLSGPWKILPDPVLRIGPKDAFDGFHTDTVTAYWFESRSEILIFYKGYPANPQADTPYSPFGSRNAAATLKPEERFAKKIGWTILPESTPGHWAHGWIGGLQIFPAKEGGWYGLLNASPTPPAPITEESEMREPAPSQGGWAYTPQDWPVSGWRIDDEPIEWVHEIPADAINMGEGTNLWRHHLLLMPNEDAYLFYNSGPYGQERLFGRFFKSE